MQQEEENRLNCETHPESELLMIYIGDNSSIKQRLLCIECIIEKDQIFKKQEKSKFIKIKDFLTNPGMHYRKTICDEINNYIEEADKFIQQIIIHLKKFQETIQTHFEKLKQNLKSLRIISCTINKEIEKQSNFNGLRKLFQTIKKMDSFQGTQEFTKIQEEIDYLSKNFPLFYIQAVNSIQARKVQLIKDYKQILINIQEDLSQISSFNIYPNCDVISFNLENTKDFSLVILEISNGKQIKIDLLYQGSKDGLTLANYWQKCDLQSHLLTIIKLRNGNIFGGYSPCKLNRALNNWVADNTNSSFIFQYNKKEIFNLKDNKYAIFCREDCGPQFGCDFYIKNDFQQLGSSLGYSYNITGYDIQNNRTYLIGDKDTEIIECKVYKIIFL